MPNQIKKSLAEIALLLATRPMRTRKPLNAVQARVLANVEAALKIEALIESELTYITLESI